MVRIGMSGWVYPPWRGAFYPKGLRQAGELGYAAERVTSIEINGSFYAMQKPANWVRWRDETPPSFAFSVKGPRYITHLKRLADVEPPLANFFASGLLALGAKLGPVLWQLPPNLPFDAGLLDGFLSLLPRSTHAAAALAAGHEERMSGRTWFDIAHEPDRPMRHAVEVRHPSFDTDDWISLLEQHHVASVTADSAGRYPRIDRTTADFAYARLHGAEELYVSGSDDAALDRWAAWALAHLDAGRDAYLYFDNDVKVRAPFDAMGLIARLPRPGATAR